MKLEGKGCDTWRLALAKKGNCVVSRRWITTTKGRCGHKEMDSG